jgi:MFS family permease
MDANARCGPHDLIESTPRPHPPRRVLAAAFLFNLGQGVLRPSLRLYLQHFFGANYRMVTLIPVVFGAGKWAASLPTGYLLDRLGRRPLMVTGLLMIAVCEVASAVTPAFVAFLGVRGAAGMGWGMFRTVATTMMVDRSAGRGRAVSLLLVSETLGLLLGSSAGGSLYQHAGTTSPFVFEAACMVLAAGGRQAQSAGTRGQNHRPRTPGQGALRYGEGLRDPNQRLFLHVGIVG